MNAKELHGLAFFNDVTADFAAPRTPAKGPRPPDGPASDAVFAPRFLEPALEAANIPAWRPALALVACLLTFLIGHHSYLGKKPYARRESFSPYRTPES